MLKIILFILFGVIIFVVGFCMGSSWIFKRNYEFTKSQCKRGDKFWRMFSVLNRWLEYKEEGKDIVNYFIEMNYHKVAVYGIGYLGKHLIRELNGTAVQVDYIVDKKVDQIAENIMILKPESNLPEIDVIVVTAIMEFDAIADELENKVNCPIISLEDVIYDR